LGTVGRLVAAGDKPPITVGRTVKVVPCTCTNSGVQVIFKIKNTSIYMT
jgi:hypothetical protein